jgi:hypothetical protein
MDLGGCRSANEEDTQMREILEMPGDPEVRASGHEPEFAQPESVAGSEILLDPQEVACLAYRYWHERGCPCDSPQEDREADWFRAEAELRARIAAAAARSPALAEPTQRMQTDQAGV